MARWLEAPGKDRAGARISAVAKMKRPEMWWRTCVFYEVYLRSFQDSTGDGDGDLRGLVARLDYLQWLGVGAIWITPFYPSPMRDGGYDIADFCNVESRFGSLDDFDQVVAEAHARDIRVVIDFVPNHTSDKHPWFEDSRSSRRSRRRNWYIWSDGAPGGGPPSNWTSRFGGSAWSWDAATGQYYYHAFLPEQPDLNWRNPEMREAMLDVLRFWLARGVDGFRVDAIVNLVEDELLRDEPLGDDAQAGMTSLERAFTADRPETHACVAEMRSVLDQSDRDLVLIGEAHLSTARVVSYYGGRMPGFDLPFNFLLLRTPWKARSIDAALDRYMELVPPGACPNWVLGNHDEPRISSRIGQEQARIAALLTLTLPGAAFIYYGDEIGLENARGVQPGGYDRDGARTPMPWIANEGAGFTTGKPWMSLAPDRVSRNVVAQVEQEDSLLRLYRRLIDLRRRPAFAEGDYKPMPARGDVLAFERSDPASTFLVVINCGAAAATFAVGRKGRIILSSLVEREGRIENDIHLRPHEGAVIELCA